MITPTHADTITAFAGELRGLDGELSGLDIRERYGNAAYRAVEVGRVRLLREIEGRIFATHGVLVDVEWSFLHGGLVCTHLNGRSVGPAIAGAFQAALEEATAITEMGGAA